MASQGIPGVDVGCNEVTLRACSPPTDTRNASKTVDLFRTFLVTPSIDRRNSHTKLAESACAITIAPKKAIRGLASEARPCALG